MKATEVEELLYVPLKNIRVNPQQPRKIFSALELEELAESIKTVGLIHPPVVRTTEISGLYEIVSGERRYRACELVGLKEIPVIVRSSNHSLFAQIALIENIQRVDLNALEIAQALRNLMSEFHFSQDEVALKVGKKRSTISNYLRLLTLPKDIQDSIVHGKITMGHAKAILSFEDFAQQLYLHNLIIKEEMSVRTAEAFVKKHNKKIKKNRSPVRDLYLEQLVEKLQYKLGTKVTIQGKGEKGSITIDYFNLDDLDRLLGQLGIVVSE